MDDGSFPAVYCGSGFVANVELIVILAVTIPVLWPKISQITVLHKVGFVA